MQIKEEERRKRKVEEEKEGGYHGKVSGKLKPQTVLEIKESKSEEYLKLDHTVHISFCDSDLSSSHATIRSINSILSNSHAHSVIDEASGLRQRLAITEQAAVRNCLIKFLLICL